MWRQLKLKKENINYKSPSMLQAIKKAEEKKRADAAKALEQAERRRKRAESRIAPQGCSDQTNLDPPQAIATQEMEEGQRELIEGGEEGVEDEEEVDELEGAPVDADDESSETKSNSGSDSSGSVLESFLYEQKLVRRNTLEPKLDKGKERKISAGESSEEEPSNKKKKLDQSLIEKDQRIARDSLKKSTHPSSSKALQASGLLGRKTVNSLMDRLVEKVKSGKGKDVKRLRKELDVLQSELEDLEAKKKKRKMEEKEKEKEEGKNGKKGKGKKGKGKKTSRKNKHSRSSSSDESSPSSSDQKDDDSEHG
ncbi:uncharacterized protein MELLADRAFT_59139 [Melampsora larici-populina 98AG31]|uniref:Uncharacterized protein n=1 Tax=Melampsora larici-populina (strain 98AG31 / pathotype 3-4-7) TaxID=747676 RepID=F4R563_MELLP|nr:uncharacterized protein MELLADRAFT_59139 [Melampsora larici-populina 98AG31]EGG12318.1 hypothetical protein MELLADRAFT_59139 [Melampsora larici-populina 98AG31]